MNKMNNCNPAGKPAGRPGSAPGGEGPKPTKQRRQRTQFSAEQVEALRAFFDEDPYPDHGQRQELAKQIGVDEGRISVWFQNRRARHPKGEEGEPGKQPKAKQPRRAKRAAPQSQTGALPPPTAAAATQRAMMGQCSWTGQLGTHPHLGQTWASQDPFFTRGYQYGSNQFGNGQTTAFNNSSHWSPSIQNPHFCFGAGAQDWSWKPQQQSQMDYTPCYSGFHLGAYYQGQVPIEDQQLGGQASVAPDSMVNTEQAEPIMDIIRYLKEDGGSAVPSTPEISPALPGEVPSVRQEQSPSGTSSACQSYLPSTAQWPPCPQWGTLPGQDNSSHWQIHQGPSEMALGNRHQTNQ